MARQKKQKKAFREFSDDEFEKYRHNFVKAALRRASYRWPWRNIAIQNSRVAPGQHKCAGCPNLVHYKAKKLDHIYPVVDPHKGFAGWDSYAERLLVRENKWQVLCKVCHDRKTSEERAVRKLVRKLQKERG